MIINNNKKLIKILFVFLITIFSIVCFSCDKKYNSIDIEIEDDYNIFNVGIGTDTYIIIPKNQTEAQSLSIIIKNKNDGIIIFDGGRAEDAKYLENFILNNGGKVEAWYLTHIHDDHIGAIYEIFKKNIIDIKNLYYNFADFNWYYEKSGNDAGALILFNEELKKYSKSHNIVINNSYFGNRQYNDFFIETLNNIYKIDSDSINNTSIVYKVKFDKKSMIILGDLGYYGGKKLLEDVSNEKLLSDIVVLSHHGQNGVDENVYKVINPKIAIWPTTKRIYENVDGKYRTNETKKKLEEIGVKYNILSFEKTSVIK